MSPHLRLRLVLPFAAIILTLLASPASGQVPDIGAIKCSIPGPNGVPIPVPCDDPVSAVSGVSKGASDLQKAASIAGLTLSVLGMLLDNSSGPSVVRDDPQMRAKLENLRDYLKQGRCTGTSNASVTALLSDPIIANLSGGRTSQVDPCASLLADPMVASLLTTAVATEFTADSVIAAFISSSAAAAAAAKPQITLAPLTSGSATPASLSGVDLSRESAEYEARKADVFRRLVRQSQLRDECRAKLPSCSTDGRAYDKQEDMRRRDYQYFLWGEASYYIRWDDLLAAVPTEMAHEMGTLGGVKLFGQYGLDSFYVWLKRDVGIQGSTPPGGDGAARLGLQKAINDNRGLR